MKIKCPACGNENYFSGIEESTKFCSNCNTPLDNPVGGIGINLNAKNHPCQLPSCNAYEKAEETANKVWQKVKEATKKSDTSTLNQTIKDYCKAMKLVIKIWPKVVEELGIEVTSATANAYSAGYCEAAKEYGLPENLACLRGDHVASKTLYKVSHWMPFK